MMESRMAAPFPTVTRPLMPGHASASIPPPDLGTALAPPFLPLPAEPEIERLDIPIAELSFRHLQTPEEIARIVHLRKEIQLPAAALADPSFAAREKKKMRRVSWPLSSAGGLSSAPSA